MADPERRPVSEHLRIIYIENTKPVPFRPAGRERPLITMPGIKDQKTFSWTHVFAVAVDMDPYEIVRAVDDLKEIWLDHNDGLFSFRQFGQESLARIIGYTHFPPRTPPPTDTITLFVVLDRGMPRPPVPAKP